MPEYQPELRPHLVVHNHAGTLRNRLSKVSMGVVPYIKMGAVFVVPVEIKYVLLAGL